ncbi:hypothetical protein [Mongoliitalea lutea]|uniref:DUF2846 domain-containing protein n=1 Tax=Mongoliitalea lutea TaxID=849756 RepID=A0A8J3CY63_9BACT|nr:hypothetical protein [Mongoliitalea lutea]GHB38961.1 hypothetical protein GCM10008106_20210 [Mongoliitalea lutea]
MLGFLITLLLFPSDFVFSNEKLIRQNQEEYASIVIYVKSGRQLAVIDILFDDVPVISTLPKNTYFLIKHRPGKVSLKTKGRMWRNLIEERDYSLTLEAGNTYYLEAKMEYQVLMTSLHLVRKSSQVGAKETNNMRGEIIDLTKSN